MSGRMELHPELLFQDARGFTGTFTTAAAGVAMGTSIDKDSVGKRPLNADFPNVTSGAGQQVHELSTLTDEEQQNHTIGALLLSLTVAAQGSVTVRLQDSADDSAFADVADVPSRVFAAGASNFGSFLCRNTRRYVRLVGVGSASVVASGGILATREG